MPFSVLIYSADMVRGKILLKSLQKENILSVLCKTAVELNKAINTQYYDVLVFDTKQNFWNELSIFKNFSGVFKKTTTIILADLQNQPFLKTSGIRHDLCMPDPFDPEAIVGIISTIDESKKKTFSAAA
ncbi:MAG: hypothetical protein WCQ99_15545 [Pseudomonadota bacterium]